MLSSFLNNFSRTASTPVCHGKANMYNFKIPKPLCKGIDVCCYGNISNSENKITGDRKKATKAGNAFDVDNSCFKEYRYFNYQKCNLHSSSFLFSYSNKYNNYKGYQDVEKRESNILIAITMFLICCIAWGYYKMDLSPYDKPLEKVEKL